MAALAVYVVAFVVYLMTADASLGWLDAPEFIAAGNSLGIAHSPGHPATAMIGKAASLIPFGDIPFRVNLASGMLGAGAVSATFCLARSLLSGLGESSSSVNQARSPINRAETTAAAAAALIAGFSSALWFQSVRAEVYGLQAALVIIALACAVEFSRSPRPRFVVVFGLSAGLAIANHNAIAATVLLPAGLLILWRACPFTSSVWCSFGIAAGAFVLGLASLLYLPVRAATNPALNWGSPDSLGRFWWTISGKAFHKTAGADHVSTTGQDAAQSLVAVVSGATIPLALLALVGIYVAIRNRRVVAPTLALVAVIGLSIVLRAVLGFDPETPDHHAYLAPAIIALVVLGVVGVFHLVALVEGTSFVSVERSSRPRALAAPIASFALMLLAVLPLVGNAAASDQSSASVADTFVTRQFEALPPRTLLLTSYFETNFQLMSAREVFAIRPDIDVIDRSFLTYPGMVDAVSARHPELEELIRGPLAAGPRSPLALLDKQAQNRVVMVELHPNVDDALAARLVPLGPFAMYSKNPAAIHEHTAKLDADAMERFVADLNIASDAPSYDRHRGLLALVWRDYLRLEHYCRYGPPSGAKATAQRMSRYAPADRQIGELIERCKPPGVGNSASKAKPKP